MALAVGLEEVQDAVLHEDPALQTVRGVALGGEEHQLIARMGIS
jgi:hypothetical protein